MDIFIIELPNLNPIQNLYFHFINYSISGRNQLLETFEWSNYR